MPVWSLAWGAIDRRHLSATDHVSIANIHAHRSFPCPACWQFPLLSGAFLAYRPSSRGWAVHRLPKISCSHKGRPGELLALCLQFGTAYSCCTGSARCNSRRWLFLRLHLQIRISSCVDSGKQPVKYGTFLIERRGGPPRRRKWKVSDGGAGLKYSWCSIGKL